MFTGIPIILAVLAVVLVGYGLSRSSLTGPEFWAGASRVGYWVLFPVLLFRTIVGMDAPAETIWPLLYVLLSGLALITIIMALASWIWRLESSAIGCVLQGSFRHNGFVALAVVQGLYADVGLALAAIAISVLVPPSNVLAVVVMALTNSRRPDNLGRYIIREIVRNPLIIAIVLALLMRGFSLSIPPVLDEASELLAQSALTFMLLTVGAGLRFSALAGHLPAILLATGAKLLIFPSLLVAGGLIAGLPAQTITILAVFGAVPTAASSFTLAQEMQGDAPLMADIIMLQTLLCIPGLIIWIWLLG